MSWTLIDSDDALEAMLVEASRHDLVAIDTEFMRRNTFYPQVALLQVCFDDTAWLVDPLAISEPGALIDVMENPAIVKVLHSASEDLEVFQHWLGVLPAPLFDTQRADALLGHSFGLGYRALVEKYCAVELDKGETRSDWLARPLSERQCEYAARDVTYLLPVGRRLFDECERAGRLQWVLDDGADAATALASNAGSYHKKIKSAWKLDSLQLAALVAICDWREHTARKKDKPRSWIIDDKACFELAEAMPRSRAALEELTHIASASVRRYGDELLAQLAGVKEAADPATVAALPKPLSGEQRSTLKKLKSAARDLARSLAVAPEVLLPARDYELLVREASGETIAIPPYWGGWRQQTVINPLRQKLAGSGA